MTLKFHYLLGILNYWMLYFLSYMLNFISSRSLKQFVKLRFFIVNFNFIHIIQSFLFILKRFSCLILHCFLVILLVIIPSLNF